MSFSRAIKKDEDSVVAYSAPSGTGKFLPRVFGSAIAGVSELALFHPVDTIAKRLMSNQKSSNTSKDLNAIVFKNAKDAPLLQKWRSLFPGLGFAAGYKILQRIYKFGGQPYVKDWMNKNYGETLQGKFGKTSGQLITASLAGSIMGIGEIVLLPLDILKIKSQTNPEALKGKSVFQIFRSEGRGLYSGAGWTAARNAPGSFALFGGSAFTHRVILGLEDPRKAGWMQNVLASFVGAICSITVAAPLDVVKTRIQNRPFDAPESGVKIITNLVKDEGFGAFFKGLTPKILVVGPKLIFSFTVAQTMIGYFERTMS